MYEMPGQFMSMQNKLYVESKKKNLMKTPFLWMNEL